MIPEVNADSKLIIAKAGSQIFSANLDALRSVVFGSSRVVGNE